MSEKPNPITKADIAAAINGQARGVIVGCDFASPTYKESKKLTRQILLRLPACICHYRRSGGGRSMTAKIYGRNYRILWDSFSARYRIELGDETIGFHQSDDGAKALAVAHASHSFALGAIQPYSISFQAAAPSESTSRS